MARNAEKAMTALARWQKMKEEEARGGPEPRRPNNPLNVTEVKEAEKWRREIVKEVANKIAQIQNPGLGEYKIRDMNDDINKLLKQKYNWEARIKELGGPDYKRIAPKMLDREGKEVPGNRGYKYFGAAKDLPGVRELFSRPAPDTTRKTQAELMRDIDADYYGYMDDDDGILIPLEREQEEKSRSAMIEAFRRQKESQMESDVPVESSSSAVEEEDPDIYRVEGADSDEEEQGSGLTRMEFDEKGKPRFIAHVPVPSQKDIEEALLRRKKMELLEKYTGDSLLAEQSSQAKTLLGYEQTEPPQSLVSGVSDMQE